VLDHWRGSVDIKELVTNIAIVAEYFLPKKIKNVLRGKIERASGEGPPYVVVADSPATGD
jgi:hypothetical protein